MDYLVKLNNLNSVPLKGEPRILLVAGQTVRVEERPPFANQERYSIVTVAYTYGFSVVRGLHERELLTFHWNRDQRSVPRGHLHIGRGLLAQPTPIRPADFPKAHVPTGFVHFAAVVRFAITELGAMALTSDWDVILADAG